MKNKKWQAVACLTLSALMSASPLMATATTTTPTAQTQEKTDTKADAKANEKKATKPFTLDHFKMIVNALKTLGVSEQDIVTYIKEGKKLEDILKAEKIKPKKFKKAILKEYYKALDEAEKQNLITDEQEKQLKTAIKETVKNWLPKK